MKNILLPLLLAGTLATAQGKIEKLDYAKTSIAIPEHCSATSAYEITDCNGFSAQWLYLDEAMVRQQIERQIEQQLDYHSKKKISFTSQNQTFKGHLYQLKNKTCRVIGFGRVDGIPIVLNLGFQKEVGSNADLTEFEQHFMQWQEPGSDNATVIMQIKKIFEAYVDSNESTDSKANKELMTRSLKSIGNVTDVEALELLIHVWMYYDPTDFADSGEIERILLLSKPQSIAAVRKRIKSKKEWEKVDTAPYSDLKELLNQLESK